MHSAKRLAMCLLAALWLGLGACAPLQNYGRLDPSSEVKQAFESYSVNPDYRYYITRSEVYPTAIIGLSREVHLTAGSLWKEVEMTPGMMRDMIGYGPYLRKFGYKILDDRGQPIGVWYSRPFDRTFVQMEADRTVRIDTPTRHEPTFDTDKLHK